jgi:hypothetical protein
VHKKCRHCGIITISGMPKPLLTHVDRGQIASTHNLKFDVGI